MTILLGRFQLTGIPAAARGIPQIEVTFDIDANGIVNVSAKDLGSGKSQNITITSQKNMSDDEIEKKVREAEQFADEDKKRKELIEAKNSAESLIYQTEKSLKDLGDKISDDEKSSITSKVDALKNALNSDDPKEIKSKSEDLTNDFYKISQKLYENVNPNQAGTNASGEGETKADDDVVDADYEVVDEDEDK